MIKNLILLGVSILLISCETTSPISVKPEIVIEPSEKIIYQPEKSLPTEKVEEVVVNEIQILQESKITSKNLYHRSFQTMEVLIIQEVKDYLNYIDIM